LRGGAVPKFITSLREAVRYTRKYLEAGEQASQKSPERVLTVVYRKLVNDPERETKRICQFLGIQWNADMLQPKRFRHLGEKGMTCDANAIWYNKHMFDRNIETCELDKWKRQLSSVKQAIIVHYFKNNHILTKLGMCVSLDHMHKIEQTLLECLAYVYRGIWSIQRKVCSLFEK
jgi:hypothetical protein